MAAEFPIDTSKPWTFNGVTYRYDASEDRWYVVSSTATDEIYEDIDSINNQLIQGIDSLTNIIDAASAKNNQQDAQIAELDQRVDGLSENRSLC